MFSFDEGHTPPTLRQAELFWKHSPKGQGIIKFLASLGEAAPPGYDTTSSDHDPQDRFMDPGNDRLLDINFADEMIPGETWDINHRSYCRGMPVSFVKTFCLEKVFLPKYEGVEFGLALPAIDYLHDLECTRRRTLCEAAKRLSITKDNWQYVLTDDRDALAWVKDAQSESMALETSYAALFVGLRIWTMIHELQAKNFVKENVLAMLNTLFPPSTSRLPSRITPIVLHRLRNSFHRYVIAIEANGVQLLDGYLQKLEAPGSKYTWMKVRKCVEDYIKNSEDMIKTAREIHSVKDFGDQMSSNRTYPHIEYVIRSIDTDSINAKQPSSSSGLSGSVKSTTGANPMDSSRPALHRPPTPLASTGSINNGYVTPPKPTTQYSTQAPEIEFRGSLPPEGPPSKVRGQIIQEQQTTASSNRPTTSDDIILPGTPLLPSTAERTMHSDFDISMNSQAKCLANNGTRASAEPDGGGQPYKPSDNASNPPTLKLKSSISNFLRKKFSIGALSASSSNLRAAFTANGEALGLGISLGPSKPVENLHNNSDSNTRAYGRPILKKQQSLGYLEESGSRNNTFRSGSGTIWALETIDSRTDALESGSIALETMARSCRMKKIKKKTSLSAIFAKKTPSPPIKDAKDVYLKTDDEHEQYVLLSELQLVQTASSTRSKKVEKASSHNALKSVADSQAAITSTVRSKKLQKTPKLQSMASAELATEARTREPRSIEIEGPFKYNWNPDSEEWKYSERLRRHYLEKHRAEKFDLDGPGSPPRRPTEFNDETEALEHLRATPKPPQKPNSQRSDSIVPTRHTPKTPTQKKHIMIDVNKYARV